MISDLPKFIFLCIVCAFKVMINLSHRASFLYIGKIIVRKYFDLVVTWTPTSLYDSIDNFNLHITKFRFHSNSIMSSPAYGVLSRSSPVTPEHVQHMTIS